MVEEKEKPMATGLLGNNVSGSVITTGYVTPQMYGCVGDGATDDTANLSACLNSGKPILLMGDFNITSRIVVTGACSIIGGGSTVSRIRLGTTSAGLTINIGGVGIPWGWDNFVNLRDFVLVPMVANISGSAVLVTASAAIGSSMPTAFIQNVNVIPYNTTSYTQGGIAMQDCRNFTIDSCQLLGCYGNDQQGSGISVYASLPNGAPCNFKITNNSVAWWFNGIYIGPYSATSGTNDPEGSYIIHNDLLACLYAVNAQSNDLSGTALFVEQCNISFGACGIYCINVSIPMIKDNYLLANQWNTSSSSYGMIIASTRGESLYGVITGNFINFVNGRNSTSRVGIYEGCASGATWNIIHSNQTLYATTPFTLTTSQTGVGSGGGFSH